jgi:hypothetical protein
MQSAKCKMQNAKFVDQDQCKERRKCHAEIGSASQETNDLGAPETSSG